jgi:hypothetical protein
MHKKSLKGGIKYETLDLESRPVAAHDLLEQSQLVTVLIAADEVFVVLICRKQNGICAQGTENGFFATIPDVVVASVGGFVTF